MQAASSKDAIAKAPVLIPSDVWFVTDMALWPILVAPAPVAIGEPERPRHGVSSWQFERRMVRPARAPSEFFA